MSDSDSIDSIDSIDSYELIDMINGYRDSWKVKLLLSYQSNPSTIKSGFEHSIKFGYFEIFKVILDYSLDSDSDSDSEINLDLNNAFYLACSSINININIIKELIKNNVDPSYNNHIGIKTIYKNDIFIKTNETVNFLNKYYSKKFLFDIIKFSRNKLISEEIEYLINN